MKKIIGFIFLIGILFFSTLEGSAGEQRLENHIFIVVNDHLISFHDVYPIVKSGVTYVPIRFFTEHMDATINWDNMHHDVMIAKRDKKITLNIQTKALFTDEGHVITEGLLISDNRIMVPFAFIARYFGYTVSYISQGPIARAQNVVSSLTDDLLFFKLQRQLKEEQLKMLQEIQRKQAEENARRYQEGIHHSKVAYITFDDGPSMYTEQILEILDRYHAKATFFMLSGNIARYPHVVKKLVNQGHAVGLHGVTHNIKKMYKSPAVLIFEMDTCNNILQKVAGFRTDIVRVPYGSKPYMEKKFKDAITNAGYKLWDWNVDSKDSHGKNITPQNIIACVTKQIPRTRIPVILFHERQETVEALPHILHLLQEKNYILMPINENVKPVNFWK